MTTDQIKALLKTKERTELEFKEARTGLPGSFFESVCAFLNRDGGTILLGVKNDGAVIGIDPDAAEKILQDIVNLSNNPQKLDPPFILSPQIIHYDSFVIMAVRVPSSSQVHRCNAVVYDRSHDGDFRVADPVRIAAMVNRKQNYYTELTVYPYLRINDFEPNILNKARALIRSMTPKHPWLPLNDEDLLIKAGFWRNDPLTGREGYTLAAGLMFGKEEVIQQMIPAYKIDALVRRKNMNRYDDRLNVRVNLIDAYDLLMDFIAKHLPDPFYLEGTQRINLRDKIFREIVANLLVHREYTDARPATLIIYRDRVETSNPARPHGHGPILPNRFKPFSKNPTLSKFFMQMGRGEELGSGVLNVNRYLPLYAKGAKPQFMEGDPFETIIPLPPETREEMSEEMSEKMSEKTAGRILSILLMKPESSIADLAAKIGVVTRTIERNLKILQVKGRLRRIGPDKGGHWEIVDKNNDG